MQKRRLLAFLTFGVFSIAMIIAPVVSAASASLSQYIPKNTFFSLEFENIDAIKSITEAILEGDPGHDAFDKALLHSIRNGNRIGVSASTPPPFEQDLENILLFFPVDDEHWNQMVADATSEMYNDIPVYSENDYDFFTRLNDIAVYGSEPSALTKAIDLFQDGTGESLINNLSYASIAHTLLPENFASMYLDVETFLDLFAREIESDPEPAAVHEFLKTFYKTLGMSVAESPDGYQFKFGIQGNKETILDNQLSLNPGGTFIPYLYTKFPGAKPIVYVESFNPKKVLEFSKKINNNIQTIHGPYLRFEEISADLRKSGLDIPAVFQNLEKAFALAIQYDQNQPYPYLTMLGDVSNDRNVGLRLRDALVASVRSTAQQGTYTIDVDNDIAKITFITPENSDLPPYPERVFTIGVTSDNLFILSDYPDAEKPEVRSGIANDNSFREAYNAESEPLTLLAYVNARNFWSYADNFLEWIRTANNGKHKPSFAFYKKYYIVRNALYRWQDALIIATGSDSNALYEGKLRIDEAVSPDWDAFISDLKNRDTDNDGINDFEERFLYNTPIDIADSDGDGVTDAIELKEARNPYGDGKIFSDVSAETSWYAEYVGALWNNGIITGYKDNSFKPNNYVTRAEFVALVMRAFKETDLSFTGFNPTLDNLYDYMPTFNDIPQDAWFYDLMVTAYKRRLIYGTYDYNYSKSARLSLRPLDKINRAEAITILNRASETLKLLKQQQYTTTPPEVPFEDISSSNWFYRDVAAAYEAGIVKQKSQLPRFSPDAYLVRAEAAGIIMRTLQFEAEYKLENDITTKEVLLDVAEEIAEAILEYLFGNW